MAEGQFGPMEGFGEGLFEGGGDALRALVEEVVQELIQAEADAHFGAAWNAKGLPRPNGHRNGFKPRELRTRTGTLRLRMPQARDGSFFPSCLSRWQTSEQALAATLGEMVIKGVSTRKVAKLASEMLGVAVSASTVSNLVKAIEPRVEAFRSRPLGRFRYLIVDARFDRVRMDPRVVSRAFLWAAGVTWEGQREVLGFLDWQGETERAWAEFFRQLKGRGLEGIELVVSDAHGGLVKAIEEAFPGAMWQECQTHLARATPSGLRPRHARRAALLSFGQWSCGARLIWCGTRTRPRCARICAACSRPAAGSGPWRNRPSWKSAGRRAIPSSRTTSKRTSSP